MMNGFQKNLYLLMKKITKSWYVCVVLCMFKLIDISFIQSLHIKMK